MLDNVLLENSDTSHNAIESALLKVPCHIELPPSMQRFLEEQSRLAMSIPDEHRQYPRLILRTAATLQVLPREFTYTDRFQWPVRKASPVERGDYQAVRQYAIHRGPPLANNAFYRVYLKDISQYGIGLLHFEQLYPLDKLRVLIPPSNHVSSKRHSLVPTNQALLLTVMRCRRLGPKCYEIGARIER